MLMGDEKLRNGKDKKRKKSDEDLDKMVLLTMRIKYWGKLYFMGI